MADERPACFFRKLLTTLTQGLLKGVCQTINRR